MKRCVFKVLLLLFAVVFAVDLCHGKGLLPSQVYKRGLTNEQIDWILEKQPTMQLRIDRASWQAMRFELCRYHNVTNWADTITSSNQFSDLLLNTQEKCADQVKKIAVLVTDTNRLTEAVLAWKADSEEAWREWAVQTNNVAVAEAAEAVAREAQRVAEAAKAESEAKLEKVKANITEKRAEYQEKYDSGSVITKPIYKLVLSMLDGLLKLFEVSAK